LKQEPEEIPDTEHELVLERVCAIDVAKDSGKVCVRVSSRAGKRVSKVWDVPARSGAVAELAEHLLAEGIEKVTVESTSDYWRIWFYVLEAAGLSVQLVNARDVKNVPGRPKTDLLTELSASSPRGCVRRRVRLARFAAREQRCECAAGVVRAGGAAAGFAGGDRRAVRAVSAC
jgi:transposase